MKGDPDIRPGLPLPRIARDVPPHPDSLLAIACRRASYALYRRTPRFFRSRQHECGIAPQMIEHLAVYLGDALPDWMVARLGPSRLLKLAAGLLRCGKACALALKFLLKPAIWLLRKARSTRADRHARAHRKHIEASYMSRAPGAANLGVLLDGRVLVEGFRANGTHAHLWMRPVQEVRETCQVFVHFFPESAEALTDDRRVHGYFCKDHYPTIEIKDWRSDRSFRDDIPLTDLPSGYYRVEAGLIDVKTLRKFPLDGAMGTSIDLGWIRVGGGT